VPWRNPPTPLPDGRPEVSLRPKLGQGQAGYRDYTGAETQRQPGAAVSGRSSWRQEPSGSPCEHAPTYWPRTASSSNSREGLGSDV
jgi:hypothetical protein